MAGGAPGPGGLAQPASAGEAMAGEFTGALPVRTDRPDVDDVVAGDSPWNVVVWNDPVNLMEYVVYVFRKLFGHSRGGGHPLDARRPSRRAGVVACGPREKSEVDCYRLHHYGLWATLEKT